jgi:hypothetical protein
MAYIFDSLGYAKRLRDGGVPQAQAEAHAEAARDFIMVELASRSDLLAIKSDLLAMKQELQTDLRSRVSETEFRKSISDVQTELRGSIADVRNNITELRSALEAQSLRLTIRLGAMMVVMVGALATILKLA